VSLFECLFYEYFKLSDFAWSMQYVSQNNNMNDTLYATIDEKQMVSYLEDLKHVVSWMHRVPKDSIQKNLSLKSYSNKAVAPWDIRNCIDEAYIDNQNQILKRVLYSQQDTKLFKNYLECISH